MQFPANARIGTDGDPFADKSAHPDFGAAFTAQFQGLRHENAAEPNVVNGVNANQLIEIGNGNNSTANLFLHAQLADGIRVQLTSYLSSRHHNETWVKDGFIQMDKSPIPLPPLETLMKYTTLKVGHFEINYGDAHFRRTDRAITQYAFDVIHRAGPSDELFVAARFNKVEGQLAGIAGDVGAKRWQFGAGMFLTPMIMAKLEYVTQEFTGYPVNHVRHGGKFNGVMLEGVVGF